MVNCVVFVLILHEFLNAYYAMKLREKTRSCYRPVRKIANEKETRSYTSVTSIRYKFRLVGFIIRDSGSTAKANFSNYRH